MRTLFQRLKGNKDIPESTIPDEKITAHLERARKKLDKEVDAFYRTARDLLAVSRQRTAPKGPTDASKDRDDT